MEDLSLQKIADALAANPDFARALADGKTSLEIGYENLDENLSADEDNTRPYLRIVPAAAANWALPAPSVEPRPRLVRAGIPWSAVWFAAFAGTLAFTGHTLQWW